MQTKTIDFDFKAYFFGRKCESQFFIKNIDKYFRKKIVNEKTIQRTLNRQKCWQCRPEATFKIECFDEYIFMHTWSCLYYFTIIFSEECLFSSFYKQFSTSTKTQWQPLQSKDMDLFTFSALFNRKYNILKSTHCSRCIYRRNSKKKRPNSKWFYIDCSPVNFILEHEQETSQNRLDLDIV